MRQVLNHRAIVAAGRQLIAGIDLAFVQVPFQIAAGNRIAGAIQSSFQKIVTIKALIDEAIAKTFFIK